MGVKLKGFVSEEVFTHTDMEVGKCSHTVCTDMGERRPHPGFQWDSLLPLQSANPYIHQ